MDPLSITASVAGLVTLVVQASNGFEKLRSICRDLPGRVHALSNEVNDLHMVLYELSDVVSERNRLTADDLTSVSATLDGGRMKMVELDAILQRLQKVCSDKNDYHPSRVFMWQKLHPRLQALQEGIRSTRSSLIALLGASNSRDMLRVRLDLEELSRTTSNSSDIILDSVIDQNEKVVEMLGKGFDLVDTRIATVEDKMQEQLAQMEAKFTRQMGLMYNAGKAHATQRSLSPSSVRSSSTSRSSGNSSSIGVRVTRQITAACQAGCVCVCHSSQGKATSTGIFTKFLGQLFVGYAGLPCVTPACDTESCERRQDLSVSAEYWFPAGFCWSQIVRMQFSYDPNLGPSLTLATFRQVPDDAPAVAFALTGNIDGLKSLFVRGQASPRDVSATRGYTLLRWALYGQRYETCKFLLQQGADPHYRPIAQSDDAPCDKAGDIILRGDLPARTVEILRAIAETSDFVERQNFHTIHKVVLGLLLTDLEDTILHSQEDIDVPDASGRTALEWAAARGDERAVTMLLSYGADPNAMDLKLNTPLTLAANQNHAICVRLLLEAGADPDPDLPAGIKFGTPLNCAARNASDPLVLKTLIDFNANIEATGVDGVTPLIHVARNQDARHALLLLDAGANINASARDGRTPLTTAIMYNNHDVLQLFLDRWYEYSECPRLKGPNLLDQIVRYADLRTTQIMARGYHLKVSTDNTYILDCFKDDLRRRSDVNDELVQAFDELLEVIKQASPANKESEVGCLGSRSRYFCIGVSLTQDVDSGSDSDGNYEDAMEAWEPVTREIDVIMKSHARMKTW